MENEPHMNKHRKGIFLLSSYFVTPSSPVSKQSFLGDIPIFKFNDRKKSGAHNLFFSVSKNCTTFPVKGVSVEKKLYSIFMSILP
jgi:hypothetical protein